MDMEATAKGTMGTKVTTGGEAADTNLGGNVEATHIGHEVDTMEVESMKSEATIQFTRGPEAEDSPGVEVTPGLQPITIIGARRDSISHRLPRKTTNIKIIGMSDHFFK